MQVKSFFSLNSLEKSDFGKKLKNRYAVSRYAVTGFTNNPQREFCNHSSIGLNFNSNEEKPQKVLIVASFKGDDEKAQ